MPWTKTKLPVSLLYLIPVVASLNTLEKAIKANINFKCSRQIENDTLEYQICSQNDVNITITNIITGLNDVATQVCEFDHTRCLRQLSIKYVGCLERLVIKQIFHEPIKGIHEVMYFMCRDNASPIQEFSSKVSRCLEFEEVMSEVGYCDERYRDLSGDWFLYDFYSSDVCRRRGDMIICFMDSLDKCDDKMPRDFLSALSYYMLRETGCREIIDKDYPKINSVALIGIDLSLLFLVIFYGCFLL